MPRKAKKQKSRGVVDTNVLVAGISGFRKPYVRGKNPSADVLYKWAEKGNFVWLVTEDILDELNAGANVNAQDRNANTALMAAVEYNNVEAVKLLLKAHADRGLRNKAGQTALSIASSKNRGEIVHLLTGDSR